MKPIDHETTRALFLFLVVSLLLKEHSHFHAFVSSQNTMIISQISTCTWHIKTRLLPKKKIQPIVVWKIHFFSVYKLQVLHKEHSTDSGRSENLKGGRGGEQVKPSQNKKGQKFFQVHRFRCLFLSCQL